MIDEQQTLILLLPALPYSVATHFRRAKYEEFTVQPPTSPSQIDLKLATAIPSFCSRGVDLVNSDS